MLRFKRILALIETGFALYTMRWQILPDSRQRAGAGGGVYFSIFFFLEGAGACRRENRAVAPFAVVS